jgi:hypothetical protein
MFLKTRAPVGRVLALTVVILLESLAILSIVLRITYLPMLAPIYPNIVSVAAYLLPGVVGLLTQRLETAILLAVAPYVVLVAIYQAIYALPWLVDLNTLGDLAGRVAGPIFLFGGVGALGWLLRRAIQRGLASGTLPTSAQ